MAEPLIAGVDGCREGWLYILDNGSELRASVAPTFHLLVQALSACGVICVDMPIGFSDRGQRVCDKAARQILKHPRASSVFSPPVRTVVEMDEHDYRSLCDAHEKIDGRRLSRQAVAILDNIREVDLVLRESVSQGG